MIGLVLVTHGNLAVELAAAMEHIVGKQEHLRPIAIRPDDDMEKRRQDILETVRAVDQGRGVILLTDMLGGTPSNLAISVMKRAKTEVVAGVNLPMLIRLEKLRVKEDLSLKEVALEAREAGRKYIHVASEILSEGQSSEG